MLMMHGKLWRTSKEGTKKKSHSGDELFLILFYYSYFSCLFLVVHIYIFNFKCKELKWVEQLIYGEEEEMELLRDFKSNHINCKIYFRLCVALKSGLLYFILGLLHHSDSLTLSLLFGSFSFLCSKWNDKTLINYRPVRYESHI